MNKALIYDDNCPLCVWYTGLFVKAKLLEKRIAFSEVSAKDLARIDAVRSKHEIPLLDLEGGETLYGLDSLVDVLNNKIPFLKTIMRIPFVKAFFYWLYQLISYNRRLIVGKKGCNNGFDCTPDFNLTFRSYYLLISTSIALIIWTGFTKSTDFPVRTIMISLLVIGSAIMLLTTTKLRLRYLYFGQYSTTFLIGSLLLLPSLCCQMLLGIVPAIFWVVNLILSFAVMAREWNRRMDFIRTEKTLLV
ncbi:MAG: DCC1-like thiol-disulfide oxidoreductase family protein [Bacteroidota bacterium]